MVLVALTALAVPSTGRSTDNLALEAPSTVSGGSTDPDSTVLEGRGSMVVSTAWVRSMANRLPGHLQGNTQDRPGMECKLTPSITTSVEALLFRDIWEHPAQAIWARERRLHT